MALNIRFLLFPLPLIILFSMVFQLHMTVGDYDFHLNYRGGGSYPSGLAYALNALELLMPRAVALFLIAILAVVYFPYILVFEITKSHDAAWIYLYGSGLPMILFFVWFIPQAIIHVMMLLAILFPILFFPLCIFGGFIHEAFVYAMVLTLAYSAWRMMK